MASPAVEDPPAEFSLEVALHAEELGSEFFGREHRRAVSTDP
jgi:hypothetical protein